MSKTVYASDNNFIFFLSPRYFLSVDMIDNITHVYDFFLPQI